MRRSLEIAEKALGPEHPSVASALNNLAVLYKKEGKYAAAEPLYQRCLAIMEKALGRDHPSLASALDNLAGLYSAQGRYAAAEPLYRRALQIREKALGPDHPDVASSLNDLAQVYSDQGQLAAAEPIFQRSLRIFEKVRGPEHPDLAAPLSNLAGLYGSQGNFAAAVPLQQRALQILEKAFGPDHPAVATALNNLAALYQRQGRSSAAEPLYQRALAMVEKGLGPEHPAVAVSLGNLAGVYMAEEKYAAAESLYKRALLIREKALGPEHPDVANSLNNLAVLYHTQGQYAAAAPLYQRALALKEKVLGPAHPDLEVPLRNLATLDYARGLPLQAEPLYSRSLEILRQEFEQYFTYMSEKERLLFLDRVSHVFPLYFSFCFTYQQQHPDWAGKMYDVLLWKKGFVAESMAALRTRVAASGDPQALALLGQLRDKKAELAKLLARPRGDLAQWRKQIELLEQEANQLERDLARRASVLAQDNRLARVTWRDVQQALGKDEAAIEFAKFDYHDGKAWTSKTSYVALVLKRQMTAPALVLVGEAKTLEKAALRDYRYYVGLDRWRIGAPVSFYDVVWKPLEPLLAGVKRIYLSPDSVLNQVSLGVIPSSSGRLLMEDYDLRIVSSTRDLLRPAAAPASRSAVLIGNPDFDFAPAAQAPGSPGAATTGGNNLRSRGLEGEALPALPATEAEVKSIDHLLAQRGWQVKLEDEKGASEEAIKQVKHPRVLHVATHGFFQPDQPSTHAGPGNESVPGEEDPMLRSGLFFAGANRALAGTNPLSAPDDGILTAYEATGLDLQGTELVVLSACKTGLGEVMRGEGVFGLRRALEVAGAQAVLMSLWSVPDRETQELMVLFYNKWLSGEEKHRALREAQLELRQKVKARYGQDSPLYWGGFILVGR
jgi:CHAT domain-containing protein/Tfp pilus assembly protein PilF